jgi:tRNA (guanine-N7-)-methyltransferase
MTASQHRALEELLPKYGVDDLTRPVDLDTLFARQAPRYLEIGFGNGHSLFEMARRHPDNDYIGIEVHRPGVGSLLLKIEEEQLTNLRLINHDAVEVLEQAIPDNSLNGIYLFFPDPWHKKKHNKRRIVQTGFVEQVRQKLKPGGFFHMATDWEDYALHMMETMNKARGFRNKAGEGKYAHREDRPLTKYERRGQKLGHGVWDLIFERMD